MSEQAELPINEVVPVDLTMTVKVRRIDEKHFIIETIEKFSYNNTVVTTLDLGGDDIENVLDLFPEISTVLEKAFDLRETYLE